MVGSSNLSTQTRRKVVPSVGISLMPNLVYARHAGMSLTRITGYSSVWLEHVSGGHGAEGSNPSILTNDRMKRNPLSHDIGILGVDRDMYARGIPIMI